MLSLMVLCKSDLSSLSGSSLINANIQMHLAYSRGSNLNMKTESFSCTGDQSKSFIFIPSKF